MRAWAVASATSSVLFWLAWRVAWGHDRGGWVFVPALVLASTATALTARRSGGRHLVFLFAVVLGFGLGSIVWWAFAAYECTHGNRFCLDNV